MVLFHILTRTRKWAQLWATRVTLHEIFFEKHFLRRLYMHQRVSTAIFSLKEIFIVFSRSNRVKGPSLKKVIFCHKWPGATHKMDHNFFFCLSARTKSVRHYFLWTPRLKSIQQKRSHKLFWYPNSSFQKLCHFSLTFFFLHNPKISKSHISEFFFLLENLLRHSMTFFPKNSQRKLKTPKSKKILPTLNHTVYILCSFSKN